MDDRSDPVFDRLLSTTLRLWWVLVASSLGVALVFGYVSGIKYDSTVIVSVASGGGTLDAVRLPGQAVADALPLKSDVDFLQSAAVVDKVSAAAGEAVDVSATYDGVGQRLLADLSAKDAGAVNRAAVAMGKILLQRRQEQTVIVLAPIRTTLESTISALNTRVGEIDTELIGLGASEQFYADALRSERNDRLANLVEARSQLTAVGEYQSAVDTSFATIASSAKSAISRTTAVPIGLIVGLLAALAGLALLSAFDRRIRTRSELTRVTDVPLVGALADGFAPLDVASIAMFVARQCRDSGMSTVHLVPADVGTETGSLAAAMSSLLNEKDGEIDVVSHSTPLAEQVVLHGVQDSPQVVAVIRWGRTRSAKLASVLETFEIAGARVIGCVFSSVPPRHREMADR